jgi:hypothetical protein
MNDAGQAVIVWQSTSSNGSLGVRAIVRAADGSWGEEKLLTAFNAGNPEVAINASGKAVAIWTSSNTVILAAVYDGGSWGAPTLLSCPYCTSSNPEVRVNVDGTAILVWQSTNADNVTQVMASRLSTDNVWSTPIAIN